MLLSSYKTDAFQGFEGNLSFWMLWFDRDKRYDGIPLHLHTTDF